MTGGGLRLRAQDLAKIGALLLNEGVWQGKQVLPAEWVSEATRPHVVPREEDGYGYQFWEKAWDTSCGTMRAAYMSGNGGNYVLLLPELDAVVVLTRQNYNTRNMHQQSIQLIEQYLLPALAC